MGHRAKSRLVPDETVISSMKKYVILIFFPFNVPLIFPLYDKTIDNRSIRKNGNTKAVSCGIWLAAVPDF